MQVQNWLINQCLDRYLREKAAGSVLVFASSLILFSKHQENTVIPVTRVKPQLCLDVEVRMKGLIKHVLSKFTLM